MCGIFGIITKQGSNYQHTQLVDILKKTATYSEVRGKDSSGLSLIDKNANKIKVIKGPLPITSLLKDKVVQKELNSSFSNLAFGHARLTTNGTHLKDINNQPVIKGGMVCVHNGIIVNVEELWQANKELLRNYDIDTEIMPSLIRKKLNAGSNVINAVSGALTEIFGTVSTAILFNDRPEFILATNNGSLYILTDNKEILVFASERFMLEEVVKHTTLKNKKEFFTILQIKSNTGLSINLEKFEFQYFNIDEKQKQGSSHHVNTSAQVIEEINIPSKKTLRTVVIDMDTIGLCSGSSYERKLLEFNIEKISKLKRCTKCLLPETFPFIEFDNDGECNYCKNYVKKNEPKKIDELYELVKPYRSKKGDVDCIVPFSGGRDSTYTLHIVKNILKLNPIAFTYDWGMVTDLGRRNIARVCGKLGVENIIVSADIHWKRENIRKNILAWLKKPALGMIPLFMAGDKYFFYYTDKIKKQTNVDLNIWGINPLENTDFKVGFSNVSPTFNKKRIYSLSFRNQIKLFSYVGKNIIGNPSYINQSVWDTLGSFGVRYLAPRKDYYHMFDFYKWDEKEIDDLILNEYKWEKAIDTNTTWRIGDGTAGFYNYIYYTAAGFSEYDTFRSNQIREGMMDRETALELINAENKPRYESLKWYLEIIGLDFENTIRRINQISKLY